MSRRLAAGSSGYARSLQSPLAQLRSSRLRPANCTSTRTSSNATLARCCCKLEQLQHERIEAATQSHQPVEPTASEKRAAMKFLRDPKLIERILADFDACGLAGEETNKLVCYLACVSRRLEQPLAVLIQSGSAAGKTTLMDAALSFMPEEEQIRYSAMTGQSLYYLGAGQLKHKILAIAEEEGVAQASYALKLLQSDGKLTIAAAGKNSGTGRQSTETYTVEGPVMMFLTTTSEHPDPELQNRCLTLRVNESSDQTAEIHNRQRTRYMRSNQHRSPDDIKALHHNAQRLLASLPVIMPWADRLTFRHDQTRMRRDHAKYLSLIASITLLHQHQRKIIEINTSTRCKQVSHNTTIQARAQASESTNRHRIEYRRRGVGQPTGQPGAGWFARRSAAANTTAVGADRQLGQSTVARSTTGPQPGPLHSATTA